MGSSDPPEGVSPGLGWETVPESRRQRRRRRRARQAAPPPAASDGEQPSEGGSSASSAAPSQALDVEVLSSSLPVPGHPQGDRGLLAASLATQGSAPATELLSTSLPSPREQQHRGLLAQQLAALADDDDDGDSSRGGSCLSPAGSVAQQFSPRHALGSPRHVEELGSPGQFEGLSSPRMPPSPGGMLPRQESQSAVSLKDLAREAKLRSFKSDAATLSFKSDAGTATLSVHSARLHSQRHSMPDDGGGGGGGGGGAGSAGAATVGSTVGGGMHSTLSGGGQAEHAAEGATPGGGIGPHRRGAATHEHAPAPSASTAAPATAAAAAAAAAAAPGTWAAQAFSSYLAAELHPGPSYPTADVVWGQTERDRVYNALVSVPFQLERFMLFGVAVCLDSFLAIFTLLPLRVGVALLALGRSLLSYYHSTRGGSLPAAAAAAGAADGPAAGGHASTNGSSTPQQQQQQQQRGRQGAPRSSTAWRPQLRGDQLFDLLGAAMSLGVVVFLWNLNAGTLYFWMKDLTQELLKLSVLYTALELSDKICCSFGVDVLEALAASCTQLAAGWSRRAALEAASDVAVASLLLALHGATLMSQAMVFGVAMNSKKNTLVALLIAANFTEIKGTVLKRFDTTKLFSLACQDVVERFHLLLILAFVVVEEMGNSGSRSPNPTLLWGCAHIYAGEVVIDVIKHAVLGKFNEIRPGVYREYMRDLCDRVSTSQSHNIHKPVGFEPFAPAALAFRIAATAAALRHGGGADGGGGLLSVLAALAGLLVAWVVLLAAKIGLGYVLRVAATAYVRGYEARQQRARQQRRPAALQQQHAAAPVAGKKEE